MMRMLRNLGLAVIVVCIAAFASGCGGGGGGGSTEEMPPPVMECPQGQVGTYPDCTEPGPTNEERIATARNTLAGIVSNARNLAQSASSTAAAVQVHEDATADQIASALAHAGDAQAALAGVEGASSAGNAATTPAAAEMAVADANAALSRLRSAQSAVAAVQSAVNAVAEARRQREADEVALTNNSSLIKHVRDNKLLSTELLTDLVSADGGNNRLLVGPVGDGSAGATNNGKAEFPANTGTGADRIIGQQTVMVQGLTSSSTTPSLSGVGHLTNGFDLKNADGSTFVNAFTDISQTKDNVRTRTNDLENTAAPGDPDSRYENRDFPDTDYLLAGIWLSVDNANLGNSAIYAFAHGSQPVTSTASNFCVGIEGPTDPVSSTTGITTTTRTCGDTEGFDRISIFVKDGQDVSATYRGDANGVYIAGGDTSYFRGSVELNAEFQNPTSDTPGQQTPTAADGMGSIQGAVTSIVVGGQQMAGSIELQKHTFADTISGEFGDDAVGVVDGKSFSGGWKGQFFGLRTTRSQTTVPVHTRDGNRNITATTNTITTTYSPQHPGSVAGTFQVIQKSNPADEAAFIGAFGARR